MKTNKYYYFFYKTTVSLVVLFFLFSPLSAVSKLTDGGAVTYFKLPRFGNDGYKIWEVQGTEGQYKDSSTIWVRDLVLKLFEGGSTQVENLVLQSPSATINPASNIASSNESIFIRGDGFSIQGEDWQWTGATKSIFIQNQVEVLFNQDIISILE